MGYPISLDRYDKLMTKVISSETPIEVREIVGDSAHGWEILDVTSNEGLAVIWLGHVDPVEVRKIQDKLV